MGSFIPGLRPDYTEPNCRCSCSPDARFHARGSSLSIPGKAVGPSRRPSHLPFDPPFGRTVHALRSSTRFSRSEDEVPSRKQVRILPPLKFDFPPSLPGKVGTVEKTIRFVYQTSSVGPLMNGRVRTGPRKQAPCGRLPGKLPIIYNLGKPGYPYNRHSC